MSKLLTQEEIAELTGTTVGYMQRRILNKNGIRFVLRQGGSISLTWDTVNAALTPPSSQNNHPQDQPNFGALDK